MFSKQSEGYLALGLSIVSFALPRILEESTKDISSLSILAFYCIILLFNICFEYIHSLKRAYIGEGSNIKFIHVVYCSCLSFVLFVILREVLDLSEVIIGTISIVLGYLIYYCRIKGRKDVWVTIFTSNKSLRERTDLYKYEVIYDKKEYDKLDLLILYGYITLDQLEYCKLTSLTNNNEDILNVILLTGYINERTLVEINYIYNHYKNTGILLNKDKVKVSLLNIED